MDQFQGHVVQDSCVASLTSLFGDHLECGAEAPGSRCRVARSRTVPESSSTREVECIPLPALCGLYLTFRKGVISVSQESMITFESAIEIIRAHAPVLGTEIVTIEGSLNRVLGEDVRSDVDMPPFDKAAMDGYACRRQDVSEVLEVVEVISAGKPPRKSVGSRQCAKIMTGAMLPSGADCVIIVEEVEELTGNRIRFKGSQTAANIGRRGSDVVAGRVILRSGCRIGPKELAALAAMGCVRPRVSLRPRIGIIATGDEIVEPDIVPAESQIRNSNAHQARAQCLGFGLEASYYGIARDEKRAISTLLKRARLDNDLILITGGVSMGDFDLVPAVLREQGFHINFNRVAIQPGKPALFAQSGAQTVFGMPGNPVSSFTVFEILVKEFLAAEMGLTSCARTFRCVLAGVLKRSVSTRMAWVPVKITADGCAKPVEYHGSAHITAQAAADGITAIPIGVSEIPEGSFIDVRQI